MDFPIGIAWTRDSKRLAILATEKERLMLSVYNADWTGRKRLRSIK